MSCSKHTGNCIPGGIPTDRPMTKDEFWYWFRTHVSYELIAVWRGRLTEGAMTTRRGCKSELMSANAAGVYFDFGAAFATYSLTGVLPEVTPWL